MKIDFIDGSVGAARAPAQAVEDFAIQIRAMRGRITARKLVRVASRIVGRPINIETRGVRAWGKITGFALTWPNRMTIVVRRSDSDLYRFHVILHELTQLLCGHPPCAALHGALGSVNLHSRPTDFESLSGPARDIELEAERGAYYLASMLFRLADTGEERIL